MIAPTELIERVLRGESPVDIVQEVTVLDVEVGDEAIIDTPQGEVKGTVSKVSDFQGMLWLQGDNTRYPFSAVKRVIPASQPASQGTPGVDFEVGDWVFIANNQQLHTWGEVTEKTATDFTIRPVGNTSNRFLHIEYDELRKNNEAIAQSVSPGSRNGYELRVSDALESYFIKAGYNTDPTHRAISKDIAKIIGREFDVPSKAVSPFEFPGKYIRDFVGSITGNQKWAMELAQWSLSISTAKAPGSAVSIEDINRDAIKQLKAAS